MPYRVEILDALMRDPLVRTVSLGSETALETFPCPICEASDFLLEVAHCGTGPVASFCRHCLHFFLSRRPTADWYQKHYATEWYRGGVHGIARHPVVAALRSQAARLLKPAASRRKSAPGFLRHFELCKPFLGETSTVLEVGASSGRFLQPFQRAGFSCYAIEPSEAAAAVCQSRGIPVLDRYIEDAQVERYPQTDFLFSHHSIEHHRDPNVFMQFASRLLTSGKKLCVSVPNHSVMFLLSECLFVLHTNSFTEQSLTQLFHKHGFRLLMKMVDESLTFIGEKCDGAAWQPYQEAGGDWSLARAEEAYRTRFERTVLGVDRAVEDIEVFSVSYQLHGGSYSPGWGQYRVASRRQAQETTLLSNEMTPYLRNFLLKVGPSTGSQTVLDLTATRDRGIPLIVK